jgi:hypothetical protein
MRLLIFSNVMALSQKNKDECNHLFLVSRIQGTTAVELASGLHWYLKYWCGVHISWDKTGGAQLPSVPPPGSLPRVKGTGVKIERPIQWNYYQNAVTSSCEFFRGLDFCPALTISILFIVTHVSNSQVELLHYT